MIAPLAELTERQRAVACNGGRCCGPVIEDGMPLTTMAREHAVPVRTARRWLARYRAHGLAGLARTGRADNGSRRVHPELVRVMHADNLDALGPCTCPLLTPPGAVVPGGGWSSGLTADLAARAKPAWPVPVAILVRPVRPAPVGLTWWDATRRVAWSSRRRRRGLSHFLDLQHGDDGMSE
jgi:leucine-zipper of insertion element IS481